MSFELTTCPACGSSLIGRIAANQYYCWECCVEFSIKDSKIIVYEVDSEGTLIEVSRRKFSPTLLEKRQSF